MERNSTWLRYLGGAGGCFGRTSGRRRVARGVGEGEGFLGALGEEVDGAGMGSGEPHPFPDFFPKQADAFLTESVCSGSSERDFSSTQKQQGIKSSEQLCDCETCTQEPVLGSRTCPYLGIKSHFACLLLLVGVGCLLVWAFSCPKLCAFPLSYTKTAPFR